MADSKLAMDQADESQTKKRRTLKPKGTDADTEKSLYDNFTRKGYTSTDTDIVLGSDGRVTFGIGSLDFALTQFQNCAPSLAFCLGSETAKQYIHIGAFFRLLPLSGSGKTITLRFKNL
jgi:hypothetical protein